MSSLVTKKSTERLVARDQILSDLIASRVRIKQIILKKNKRIGLSSPPFSISNLFKNRDLNEFNYKKSRVGFIYNFNFFRKIFSVLNIIYIYFFSIALGFISLPFFISSAKNLNKNIIFFSPLLIQKFELFRGGNRMRPDWFRRLVENGVVSEYSTVYFPVGDFTKVYFYRLRQLFFKKKSFYLSDSFLGLNELWRYFIDVSTRCILGLKLARKYQLHSSGEIDNYFFNVSLNRSFSSDHIDIVRVEAFVESLEAEATIIFPFEGQPFEYRLIEVGLKKGHRIIAYSHSSVRYWDLRFVPSFIDQAKVMGHPKFCIITYSSYFKNNLIEFGWSEDRIELCPKLGFMTSLDLSLSKTHNDSPLSWLSEKERVLVALDINRQSSMVLRDFFIEVSKTIKARVRFRRHPFNPIALPKELVSEFLSVEEDLEAASLVVSSNQSSVVVDCLVWDVPVLYYIPENSVLDESPIFGVINELGFSNEIQFREKVKWIDDCWSEMRPLWLQEFGMVQEDNYALWSKVVR